MSILKETQSKLNSAIGNDVEVVFLGCPHLNLTELLKITALLEGKRVHPDVLLFIGAANATRVILKEAGFLDIIEHAGGHVINACFGPFNPLIYSKNPPKITATNSARSSHYIQTSSGGKTKVLYGDMVKCINAALAGKWEE
jgi:predicted aconitase